MSAAFASGILFGYGSVKKRKKRVAWNRKCVCGHAYLWHHNWQTRGGRCQDTTEMCGCRCRRFRPARSARRKANA